MNSTPTTILSGLKSGETGIITKVKGYGAFRKRITEMGFVPGVRVKVIKQAPFGGPVEYELMGYRVSLRKSEAELIEIVTGESSAHFEKPFEGTLPSDNLEQKVKEKINTINVALVGNPNSGKTTLFNKAAHRNEKTGNYGGVTVDIKKARFKHNGYTINVTDLPGTYSISEYSPEELFVRKHLAEEMPDVVINVVDASNLERNLYLTTQLIDMNIKVVVALNMYDELEGKGDELDYSLLGKMIGIPFVPAVAVKGKGIDELLDRVIDLYQEKDEAYRHIHINYGHIINDAIDKIRSEVRKSPELLSKYHSLYTAVKLLENDTDFTNHIRQIAGTENVINCAEKQIKKIEQEYNDNSSSVITDAKYAFIRGALKETYKPAQEKKESKRYKLDNILTHKWFGFPIFFLSLILVFELTFTLGQIPTDWIDMGFGWLGSFIETHMSDGILRDLIVNGAIAGVGSVIVFFPQILILFFFLSFMEDTGYMARVAFLMDKFMHKIGLHGKSVIPIIMGFGCNVPAVMATRTLENRKDRIITMLMIPFMSCGTKYPIYLLFISALFMNNRGLILFSLYFIGIVLGILTALVLKKVFHKKENVPFVMELPPYRLPTVLNTLQHMWNKSKQYLQKMGGIILVGSVIIWALGYFPQKQEFSVDYDALIETARINSASDEQAEQVISSLEARQQYEQMEQSYIARIGHSIEPVFRPLNYDWKIGVSLFTGVAAKELIMSTLGILYQSTDEDVNEDNTVLQSKIREQEFESGPKIGQKVFTPVTTYSLLLFILIYFPCIAVIAAIKKEAGWRWAIFVALFSCSLAWVVAFIATRIGEFL